MASTIKRLTLEEIDVILAALDAYAMREDLPPATDKIAGELADVLLGSGDDIAVTDIIALYEDGPVIIGDTDDEPALDAVDEEVEALEEVYLDQTGETNCSVNVADNRHSEGYYKSGEPCQFCGDEPEEAVLIEA